VSCADDKGVKTFREGTHRVIDPAATLARVMPLAVHMGITRVAMLTGLDVLGIPVAAAVRPNSRSIAVHQGKGVTIDAAKASAIMEAVECFHAENIVLPLQRASFTTMSKAADAADPATLPRCGGRAYSDEPLLWISGRDLLSGRTLWVPHELVSVDFTAPLPTPAGLFQATTNGLAAGNDWREAVLHALYEVVERDAVALWRALPEAAQDACALNLNEIDGELGRRLLACFATAGVSVRIWDVTSDIGLPTFICLAASPDEPDAVEPELGSGCHCDRDIALSRALTETAQARLTRISGARDDFDVMGYRPEERAARQGWARRWMSGAAKSRFRAPATLAGADLRHDLDVVLTRLAAAGIAQVGCVCLTRAELGIPVVRVVVPGLEGPWTPPGGEYTPGVRAMVVRATAVA
jgi:YcaO-like protein with predicted kinase domain